MIAVRPSSSGPRRAARAARAAPRAASSRRPPPTARCGSSGSRPCRRPRRRRRTSSIALDAPARGPHAAVGRAQSWRLARSSAARASTTSSPTIDRVEIGYTWYAKRWQRSYVNTSCKLLLLHARVRDARLQGRRPSHRQVQLRLAARDRGARREEGRRHSAFLDAPRRLGARRRHVQHHRERVARGEAAPRRSGSRGHGARRRRRKRMNTSYAPAVRRRAACAAASLGAAAPRTAARPRAARRQGRHRRRRASLREALAIRDGKILGVGSTAEIRRLAGPATRVVELDGRTVIPGLIDSHLHAVRAALSLQHRGQLDRRAVAATKRWGASRAAASAGRRAAGSSSPAAGTSCSSRSAAGRRRPSSKPPRPNNPVYVQLGYGWVVMTDDGFAKLGIRSDADLPAGGTLERDGERLTGAISGGQGAIIALFDRLPKPTFAEQVRGHARVFPRAESARAHGRRRSRRQQSVSARLSGAVRRLAARRAHGARRLQLERPDGGRRARRAAEPHGAAADGLRRRPAALQRARRAHHLCDEQQSRADGRAQGALLRDRALGRRARHGDHDALGSRRHRSPHLLEHLRAREPRSADRAAALVDRAFERCVGGDAASA